MGLPPSGRPAVLAGAYALPSDAYDAYNIADRRDYFQSPRDEPASFGELLADLGLKDTSRTPAEGSPIPENPLSRLVAPDAPERLTLAACQRPADAVLILDFGVANGHATPGIFVGVLRSWETGFGVLPVKLDSDWTQFQVLAPPADVTAIERPASEVTAFAIDSASRGGFHTPDRDRRVSPQAMVQSRHWLIWWDWAHHPAKAGSAV